MQNKRILIVDDDDAHLLWTSEVLSQRGYEITTDTSALNALQRLTTETYDLIISDLIMPEMTGAEFVRKAAGVQDGIKAIILTGHGDAESFVETVYGLGALEYILKPVEIDEFVAVINKLMI
jgi:DNA-binding NtrC family response regulator